MRTRIGLQLYTIRSAMEKDFFGSLEKVREAGYDCVEFAGYGGHKAAFLKKELERTGLEPYSTHVGFDQFENRLDELIDYSTELGLSWVICPSYPIHSADDCKKISEVLARAAQAFLPYQIRVGYHNHWPEFQKFNNRYALDLIRDYAGDSPVFIQVDTGWAQYAGVDPVGYIDSLGAMSGPIHCKDINADYRGLAPHEIDMDVGSGMIDFVNIISVARKNKTLDYGLIVEQEAFSGDMFDSIKIGFDNLRKLLGT